MVSEGKTGLRSDQDPNVERGFLGVRYLSLVEAPKGQGFLIRPASNDPNQPPLFGIVEDTELPIVHMRQNVPGAAVGRYLQVPGNPDSMTLGDTDTGLIYCYWKHSLGEGEAVFTPGHLQFGSVAHFMSIDSEGQPVRADDGGVQVESFMVTGVELETPLVDSTPRQYGLEATTLERFVGERQE